MPAMIAETVPALQPFTPDRAREAPACILAALIDSLTSPERYSLEVRGGELFIALARGRSEPQPARFPASGPLAATGFSGC